MTEISNERSIFFEQLRSSLVSEAALLGIVTFFAYLDSLVYALSNASLLGIPLIFVSIGFDDCLRTALYLFLSVVLSVAIVGIWPAERTGSLMTVIFRGPFIVMIVLTLLFVSWVIAAAMAVGMLIGYFDRKRKSLITGKGTFATSFAALILFLMLSLGFAFLLGARSAAETQDYYVSNDDDQLVLLARYGDQLVFKSRQADSFLIKELGKDEIPMLHKKNVGSMARSCWIYQCLGSEY